MFSKKSKAPQFSDRAPITVQTPSISAEQRQQIEQSLANLDPTWEGTECHLSVPMDTESQEQLGQLVSMFPNGEVRLQTTSGDNIIMSGGRGYQYEMTDRKPSSKPHSSAQDDADKLPRSQRS